MTTQRNHRFGSVLPAAALAGAVLLGTPIPAGAQLTDLGAALLTECAAPGDCGQGDIFGRALAVGDFDDDGYDDLAVGVPGETEGGDQNAGAVHVYYGSPGGLRTAGEQIFHQDVAGIAGVTEPGDLFGTSLAVGDFDLDGFDDLAIGIEGEDLGDLESAGAVAVLFGSASGLVTAGSLALTQDDLPAGSGESAEAYDEFGGALASNGGSGLAVGAPGEDFLLPTEQGAGLVHIFGRSGAGNALNTVTDRTQNDLLAECGTFDGNELNEFWGSHLVFGQVSASAPSLIVSGQLESFGGVDYAGRVTVMFGAAAGCFDQGTSGVAGAPEAGDYFGGALATGDFDGDGYADLAVGVPDEDLGSPVVGDTGGVNVLYGSSSGLTESGDQFFSQEVLTGTPASLNPADEFGSALATGDFDGDGHEDLAIGVPGEQIGTDAEAGLVHVVYGSANGLTTTDNQVFSSDTPSGMPDSADAGDRFGSHLAAGDFDSNGVADLAIGVPYENLSGIADVGEAIVVYGLDRALGVFGSVQFAASSATYGEGDGSTPVILTRSGSAVVAATIDHARSGGTASPGTDFTYTAGSETWSIGDDGFETYSFSITQDTLDEPNETIVFALSNPTAGTAIGSPATFTVTITDDDVAGALQFGSPSYAIPEAGGAATITVTRTGGAASAVSVLYETWAIAGTATAGGDYTAVAGTLTFGAAEASKAFEVPILDDPSDEADETVVLRLTSPGGGGVLGAPSLATLTITDDDPTGQIFRDGFETGNTAAWSAVLP